MDKTHTIPFHECWEWSGARKPKGYGVFWMDGRHECAHRASYRLFVGEIPSGMMVLHICDNPSCVNPRHLWVGTAADNTMDMVRKRRNSRKLNAGQAIRVRERYLAGDSPTEIARSFGIDRRNVYFIGKGRTWRWLEQENIWRKIGDFLAK